MKYSASIFISISIIISPMLFGQDFRKWQPENGVSVRQGHHFEWYRSSAARGAGENAGEVGIVWSDTRGGMRGIYSQVIDVDGNLKYAANGLWIATAERGLEDPTIWADPDGGWFYAWEDFTNDSLGDIYCTKINSDGDQVWDDHAPVVTHAGEQRDAKIVHDGEGGCIIVWQDGRDDLSDVYAMHILNDGRLDPEWTEDGIVIVAEEGVQTNLTVDIDGAGGMIIGWQDGREVGNSDIWTQRITPDGDVQWGGGDGIPICNQEDRQETPKLCSDGEGGAFFSWVDERNAEDTDKDIFVQRINADGELLWSDADEGIPLVTAHREQISNQIVLSEEGTAIITWEDNRRNWEEFDASAISISGVDEMERNWESPIVIADRNQIHARICPDDEGGIYAVWADEREHPYPNLDIWAQRLDRDGEPVWEENGIPVCRDDGLQSMSIIRKHTLGCAIFYSDLGSGSVSINASLLQPDGDPVEDRDDILILEGVNGNALAPQIHSKGNGEFAVIWLDGRAGRNGEHAYIQLCRDEGDAVDFLLVENGIPVSGGGISISSAVNDNGDVFVVYEDHRRDQPYTIYAQKISDDGEVMWDESGVRCAEFDYDQTRPYVVNDNEGGIIVAWRAPTDDDWYDIYMQRLDENGEPLWGAEGLQVTDSMIDKNVEELAADGEGGAVVLWKTDDDDTDDDLWMNRINADGELMWGNHHIELVSEQFRQQDPTLARHHDGFFVAWRDNRDDEGDDIYGQFINSDGTLRWQEGGIAICSSELNQLNPESAIDNEGNIWVVWEDNRNTGRASGKDIYIQKLGTEPNEEGVPPILLTDENAEPYQDGMPLSSAVGVQRHPIIVHDGQNGMWVVWENYHGNGIHSDIYATHLEPNGQPYADWEENGNVVCDAHHRQAHPQAVLLSEDGESGIAVVWEDKRATGLEEISNVYIQKLEDDFVSSTFDEVDLHPTKISLEQAFPNPFNSTIKINYALPRRAAVSLQVYNLKGQLVGSLQEGNKMAGRHTAALAADNLSSGLYFMRLKAGDTQLTQKVMLIK